MSQIGKNIELYLMDGNASGRWQATLSNWNCYSYKIQRNDIKKSDDIPEIYSPGVYFLFGRDDDSGRPFVYVGEGDNAARRIAQPHSFEKDGSYWTEAVLFVTPDGSLNKAHIKYLENRFHCIAVEVDRYIVKNGNTPTQSQVQRKVKDMLEEFIMNARLIMLALGYKVFEPQPSDDTLVSGTELLYFSRNNGQGGKATGRLEDDGFWVLKGSYINPSVANYAPQSIIKKRQQYSKSIDKHGILQVDICFGSPSYAATFVSGKNINGLAEWKNADGISLKDINGGFESENNTIESKSSSRPKRKETESTMDYLYLLSNGISAQGVETKEGFIVKKGSQFSPKESNACPNYVCNRREMLIRDRQVVDCVFVEDVLFKSPSTAAECVLGRSVNGRTAWISKDGKTLKAIQESKEKSKT